MNIPDNIKEDILLPQNVYAVEGMELNIYFDNLYLDSKDMYGPDINSEQGIFMERCWKYVPNKEFKLPVKISRIDYDCNVLNSKSCKVISCGRDNKPEGKVRCLFVGDSLTYQMAYTQMIVNMAKNDGIDLQLIGTHGYKHNNVNLDDNVHEGYGGWTLKMHFENEQSPFVFNGEFDFEKYMEVNGFDKVDFVFFFLGPNDIAYIKDDSSIVKRSLENCNIYEQVIENIHKYNENVNVGIATMLPPSKSQDAFGKSYGCKIKRHRYLRNTHIYNRFMLNAFDNKIENVNIVPLHLMLDTENNVSCEEMKPNSRAKFTVRLQNNAVHPSNEGYAQVADGFYYYIRNMCKT